MAQSLRLPLPAGTAATWLPDSHAVRLTLPIARGLPSGSSAPVCWASEGLGGGGEGSHTCSRPLWKPGTELSRKHVGVLIDKLLKCPPLCDQHQVRELFLLMSLEPHRTVFTLEMTYNRKKKVITNVAMLPKEPRSYLSLHHLYTFERQLYIPHI